MVSYLLIYIYKNSINSFAIVKLNVVMFLEMEPKLLLIKQQQEVGVLPKLGKIFKITKVCLLPLALDATPRDLDLEVGLLSL